MTGTCRRHRERLLGASVESAEGMAPRVRWGRRRGVEGDGWTADGGGDGGRKLSVPRRSSQPEWMSISSSVEVRARPLPDQRDPSAKGDEDRGREKQISMVRAIRRIVPCHAAHGAGAGLASSWRDISFDGEDGRLRSTASDGGCLSHVAVLAGLPAHLEPMR